MELIDAIHSRHSVRHFSGAPVGEAQLRALVDAAVLAPSAMDEQPWAFCIVRDPAVLQRISDAAKQHLLRARPVDGASQRFQAMLGNAAFHLFYHAPALIVICAVRPGPWAVIDCALAAENLMLAARDAGLGSCWIGLAQEWLGTDEGKAALGLPESYVPVAPVIVGHPRAEPVAVPRHTPEIHWIG